MADHGNSAREAYEAWHGRLSVDAAADTPWHLMVQAHLDTGRDITGRRVLEIAAGRGGFSCWLARTARPAVLVGADFSKTAMITARNFANAERITNVRWAVSDAHRIPHASQAFDTVISCETIEHLERPTDAIGEMARVLKPGGRLFLTTPNYLGVMG